jgi:hypothetical protein
MAGSKTGSPTIIRLARHICRVVSRYGAGNLALVATPEFATAVTALVVACEAFKLIDDFPGEIDSSGPEEDIDIPPGA